MKPEISLKPPDYVLSAAARGPCGSNSGLSGQWALLQQRPPEPTRFRGYSCHLPAQRALNTPHFFHGPPTSPDPRLIPVGRQSFDLGSFVFKRSWIEGVSPPAPLSPPLLQEQGQGSGLGQHTSQHPRLQHASKVTTWESPSEGKKRPASHLTFSTTCWDLGLREQG